MTESANWKLTVEKETIIGIISRPRFVCQSEVKEDHRGHLVRKVNGAKMAYQVAKPCLSNFT